MKNTSSSTGETATTNKKLFILQCAKANVEFRDYTIDDGIRSSNLISSIRHIGTNIMPNFCVQSLPPLTTSVSRSKKK